MAHTELCDTIVCVCVGAAGYFAEEERREENCHEKSQER